MCLKGEGSATAAAEQLVAEEAKEAAKAAAKKAKKQKQKAKAQKQQAPLDATPASEPAPEPGVQSQPDVEPTGTSKKGSPSESRDLGLPPDQNIADVQSQLQHVTLPGSARLNVEDAALDKQAPAPAATACGLRAGNAAAAVDVSCEADTKFLDQLFCCPITKVLLLILQTPSYSVQHILALSVSASGCPSVLDSQQKY